MKNVFLVIGSLILLAGCTDVRVKHHRGWMGPSTWEATDGKVSVNYYNSNCCCVAEQVLVNLAARANRKEFAWDKMADPKFRDSMLSQECERLRGK